MRASRPPPRCSTAKAADGTTVTGGFEDLGLMGWLNGGVVFCGLPDREFTGDAVAVQNADYPVSCQPPILDESREMCFTVLSIDV